MESLLVQLIVGFFAILAITMGLQQGMQPGGWLEGISNWFSRQFGSGQAQAAEPGRAATPPERGTPQPSPRPQNIAEQRQQRHQEYMQSHAQERRRPPLSPLATEEAYLMATPRNRHGAFTLAVPASETPEREIAVIPPEAGIVLRREEQQGAVSGRRAFLIELGHADGRRTVLSGLNVANVREGEIVSPSGRDSQGREVPSMLGTIRMQGGTPGRAGEGTATLHIRQLTANGELMPLTIAGRGPVGLRQQVRLGASALAAGYQVDGQGRLVESEPLEVAPLSTPRFARPPSGRAVGN